MVACRRLSQNILRGRKSGILSSQNRKNATVAKEITLPLTLIHKTSDLLGRVEPYELGKPDARNSISYWKTVLSTTHDKLSSIYCAGKPVTLASE
jgi:hypothetical protein